MIEPKNNITSKLGKFKSEIGKQQGEIKQELTVQEILKLKICFRNKLEVT